MHSIIPRKPDMLKDQSLVLESINEFSEVSASEFEPSMYKGKSAHEDNSLQVVEQLSMSKHQSLMMSIK